MKHSSFLLSLLALSCAAQAADESYRLAFSKAENVEVFVDHPAGQPWCSAQLQLRFAFAESGSQAAVERLLPKLGGLLSKQCAQAASLAWQAGDAHQPKLLQGTANAATGWLAQLSPAAAQPPAQPAAAAPVQPAAAAPVAQAAPAAPANEPATAAVAPVAEAPAPTPAPALAAAPAAPSAAAEAPAAPAPLAAHFKVGDWQPPLETAALDSASFLTQITDQNGCKLRVHKEFADEDKASLSASSKGLQCGSDGYLSGEGKVSILRSDGATLARLDGYFLRGLPIGDFDLRLSLAGFDNKNNLLFLLSSDAQNQVYYLAMAQKRYEGGWNLTNNLIALTDNGALFRQADSIKTVVMQAVPQLSQIVPGQSSWEFQAVRKLAALNSYERDDWLYRVYVQRNWSSKTWGYNPNNAENYFLKNERKQAELAQRKAQQEAQEAEQQLALYQSFREQARKPEEVLAGLVQDVGSGGYRALVRGDSRSIRQIIHVQGRDGDAWQVDYPYPALLTSNEQDPEDGWFLVSAKASLDLTRLDEQDLPMTLLDASSLQACQQEGCKDLADPLQLVRERLNNPDWTPEAAQEVVRRVWPDRYPAQAKASQE